MLHQSLNLHLSRLHACMHACMHAQRHIAIVDHPWPSSKAVISSNYIPNAHKINCACTSDQTMHLHTIRQLCIAINCASYSAWFYLSCSSRLKVCRIKSYSLLKDAWLCEKTCLEKGLKSHMLSISCFFFVLKPAGR